MKKIRIQSVAPLYLAAIVWILFGLIWPSAMLKLWSLFLVALVSVGAYVLGSKFFPGKVIEVREDARSGNAEVDHQIEQGRAVLDRIIAHNDAIPDAEISKNLQRMTDAGEAIFNLIEKEVAKASEVRRFMNYYLPTTEKLMANYRTLQSAPAKGENIQSAMQSVENSLSMIADAFEKQLDSLYKDRSFDMETDISVLETILASEGLVDRMNLNDAQKQDKNIQLGL